MRKCGDCQLCCRLLAVKAIDKKAGERCRHQKFHKGCAVYRKPGMPPECAIWNCRWLVNDDTADISRPDHSHYVIDIMPDFITTRDNETGEVNHIQIVQIWIDPKYPDAHRDPALRAYLDRRGKDGIAGLIRYDDTLAFVIFPPSMTGGDWIETKSQSAGARHTMRDIQNSLGPVRMVLMP